MSKLGWNRKLRLVMILVFLLVGWMAVDAAMSVVSAHSQAASELAIVQRYSQENHRLEHEARALTQRRTIIAAARRLGMVEKGERGLVVNGLSPQGH